MPAKTYEASWAFSRNITTQWMSMIDERNSPFFPDFPKQVQHSTIRPTANNAAYVQKAPILKPSVGAFFGGHGNHTHLHWSTTPPANGFTHGGPLTRIRTSPLCRYPSRHLMSAACATCAHYPPRLPNWPSASPWT